MAATGLDCSELECNVCYDFADEALESQCCHKLYCKPCAVQLMKASCPTCRVTTFEVKTNEFARRLVNKIEIKCDVAGCGLQVTRGTMSQHIASEHKTYECQAASCKFLTQKREDFVKHLSSAHCKELLENAGRLFETPSPKFVDPIIRTTNRAGFTARLGSSGKYYCGRQGILRCNCCDGRCGPTTGCNCSDCLQLDIERRRLPKGYLVNREGCTARRGDNGLFYCGRRVMLHDNATDGYCGPSDGNNCVACKVLGYQSRNVYSNFLL